MTTSSDWTAPDDPGAEGERERASAFPGSGEHVDDEDARRALDAQPEGNATVGDTVDTDAVDSRAHESGAGAEEVAEQADGGHRSD